MSNFLQPDEIKKTTLAEAEALCGRLRETIVETVSRNGGHLASSLGAVELCVALNRRFDFLKDDAVFFDVGHQAYAHKLLTGREESFVRLRQIDGCAGFPCPQESPADPVVAGHAGVALSQALGAAKALSLSGKPGRIIAVVGDGALGCGIFWEGLNNIRTGGERLIIILNDNQMSISPNCGALRRCLNRFIAGRFYNRVRRAIKGNPSSRLSRFREMLRRLEHTVKGFFMSSGVLFQEFGVRYFGPVDGNNLKELERALGNLPVGRPVLLHIVTRKGNGYEPAERQPETFHGISPFDRETGKTCELKRGNCERPSFSDAFGASLCALAEKHEEVVAISAAMIGGTGLADFAAKYPKRCFDVGIAEEHAVAFASGLACRGMRPFVALYSTFFQRALDNVFHDVCLNNLPVVFCIDRTGAVPDGPTHHGVFVMPFLRHLPNIEVLAPVDEQEMTLMLDYAWNRRQPKVLRYPRGKCSGILAENNVQPAPVVSGRVQVLRNAEEAGITIWSLGPELETAWKVAEQLEAGRPGLRVRIVNARFLKPFDADYARSIAHSFHVVIDDYSEGGLSDSLKLALAGIANCGQIMSFTWPDGQILPHGSISDMKKRFCLRPEDIVAEISGRYR